MEHLSPEQLATLRTRLDEERGRLHARVLGLTGAGEEEGVELQDAAAREAQRQQDIRLVRHDQARLREVEAALARMEDGTYGECEESGDPIPYGRLVIEPTARYTVEVAEAMARAGAEDDGSRDDPGAY